MYVNNQKNMSRKLNANLECVTTRLNGFTVIFDSFQSFMGFFFVRQRCHLVTNLNNACIKGTNCLFVKGGMFWTNHGKWLQCRVSFKLTN